MEGLDGAFSFRWLLDELARAHDRELQEVANAVQPWTRPPLQSPRTPPVEDASSSSPYPSNAVAASALLSTPRSLTAAPPDSAVGQLAPSDANLQAAARPPASPPAILPQPPAPSMSTLPPSPKPLPDTSERSLRSSVNGRASTSAKEVSEMMKSRMSVNMGDPSMVDSKGEVPTSPSDRSKNSRKDQFGVNKSTAAAHDYALVKGWRNQAHGVHSHTITSLLGWNKGRLRRIVCSQSFELFCAMAIVGNVIVVGSYADAMATSSDETATSKMLGKIALVFSVWFAFELTLRIAAYRIDFFRGIDKYWNLFDLVVVCGDIGENLMDVISEERDALLQNLSSLRVLRILRITRALKFIRALGFFKDFRMMVISLLRSLTTLFWSVIIFNIAVFVFSIYLMQNISYYRHYDNSLSASDKEKLEEMFGNLRRSQFTLYKAVSGGQDWGDIAKPLTEAHWFNGWVLCFYVFFTLLGVMNIITGIFVDRAIQSASNDRDEVISQEIENRNSMLRRLQRIFEATDEDNSGTITLEEFEEHLKDVRVAASFASIGLEVNEARGLFRLLDMDHSGAISIDEFVFGCMRLKGNAKSVDLVTLMYENKRMMERWSEIYDYLQDNLANLKEFEAYAVSCLEQLVSGATGLPKCITPPSSFSE